MQIGVLTLFLTPLFPGKLASRCRRLPPWARIQALRRVAAPFVVLALLGGMAAFPGALMAEERPSILLLPVVVHSSESPGYLRNGLSDMLMARFQQADQFELMQATDPALATTDPDEAIEEARNRGADFVLFGSFTRFGEGASLDMHAASASPANPEGGLREIFVHSGRIGEVIPNLDDLVGKVTRFAIDDFVPREAGANAQDLAPAPAPGSRADLRLRIRKLEQAVEKLQEKGLGGPP